HLYHPAHSSPTPRPRRSLSPTPPLSPYTTLFRSIGCLEGKREPLLAVHARLGTPPEGRSRNLITQVCDYRGFSPVELHGESIHRDRKSTRLNSSHVSISYAVFCLKKKNIASRPHS